MADGPQHEVPLRRRRESRTNYQKRLEMLKSGDVRAVVRMSNNHARIQFAAYQRDGDEIITSAASQHLEEYGWDDHTGNLPAAYLTGLLAGYRALDAGVDRAIPDLGVRDQQYATRYYAALQGLNDAGLDVPVDDVALPDEGRVHGDHTDTREQVETVKENIVEEHGE